jgi:hypothetical protein
MKKYQLFIFICLIAFSINSCTKDEQKLPPALSFKIGDQYTKNNAVVMVGHELRFGIQARGTSANITNFTIKKILENGTVITAMDTGLNSITLDIDKLFYQNVEEKVTWQFSVMDRNRMTAKITLVVFKDSNSKFGGIYYYPSIKIGYQNNTLFNHFFNPSTGLTYSNDSGTLHQDQIDMLCYFVVDGTPSPVFSSPGEIDNSSVEAGIYYPFIKDWSQRRYTKWDISVDDTPISPSTFDNAHNDSLLIVAYHDVWGKKKFKWATNGIVIPFLTKAGKKGLVKVINAESTDNGTIEFAIKIQQ